MIRSATPLSCPVCDSAAPIVRQLPAGEIRATLEGLFGAAMPQSVPAQDYALRECDGCGLVFADPMVAGDGAFYGWITAFERYHAGARWEWGVIKDQIRQAQSKTMLEIGAGAGRLMDFLGDVAGLSCVGIDVSESSVEAARKNGHDVRVAAFTDLNSVLSADETFDAIVLSHVLEHVSDPRGVMTTLLKRLNPGGKLMAAIPYSPMSRELTDWDIMNLPPHHLTRWNAQSLEGLARALGCKVQLHAAKAKSPLKRAVQDTCGEVLGDKHPANLTRAWVVLTHIGLFQRYLAKHKRRDVVNGQIAGDSVLAVFYR